MELWISITLIILVGLISSVISFFAGISHRKKIAELAIGSAEQEAKRIVNEAVTAAEAKKKEILLEGKDEILKKKSELENEISERRKELHKQEKRLGQKEETLDSKIVSMDNKRDEILEKEKEITKKLKDAEEIKQQQSKKLQEISGFTVEQAKAFLMKGLENELIHEKAVRILDFEQQLKDESDDKAKEYISLAIQRCAVEHVSEATISVVALPNDEMKGRIIGREGRNIRAIETLTGVDLIIDDTPEAITLSSFDPVRREIARIAIEKLTADGRIHPARIEEMVEKARREIDSKIRSEGERAIIEVGITSMKSDLVRLIGRLKYRTSYGQNVLDHSIEVAYICGVLASELGVEATLAKRAGLLHDIGKSVDYEIEGSHVEIGVQLAKKYKEPQAIVHAIQAHHGDVEAESLIDCIVKTADALSAARPGARRENVESYVKRLQKLEVLASSFDGVERCYAIQAGREIRIMVKPEVIDDDRMVVLAREICKRIEAELEYPGQVKVNIIRESRAVDYAR